MQADYKRDISHNYLILQGDGTADTSSYEVRMVVMNHIEGLLPCTIQGVDNQSFFYYEITSRQPIACLLENGKLGRKELYSMLYGLTDTLKNIQAYLLEASHLVLLPEYIYMDAGKQKACFCYLPTYQREAGEAFRELMEYLLPKMDHQDPDAVRIGYGVYHCTMKENFDLEQIQKELFSKGKQDSSGSREKPTDLREPQRDREEYHGDCREEKEAMEQKILADIQEEETGGEQRDVRTILIIFLGSLLLGGGFLIWNNRYIPQIYLAAAAGGLLAIGGITGLIWFYLQKKKLRHIGDTEDESEGEPFPDSEGRAYNTDSLSPIAPDKMPEGEETTLLTQESKSCQVHQMIPDTPLRLDTLFLDREVTLIGKLEDAVDYCIPVLTVSRMHCKIIVEGSGCLLQDLNSKNGTYVNGRLLESREICRLEPGDEVRIAETVFRYR